ncbi:hypothetical protein [Fervidibacillus albus]|uniref:Flagellar hook-length control protein FliK n=1 Tax=Fervidibacillus albus TaxID=2980026 RepID=A0A9E8RX21_9BACI|nr:hypothetical protein [Fervidibacillus albus]WAA10698.1 hypothetical protein OE104_05115 [Fervidibacillus albus]
MDILPYGFVQTTKQHEQPIAFRSGQIFFGKVLQLDASGYAKVQLGNGNITAKIEAPIDVSKEYWFQVIKEGDSIRLTILPEKEGKIFGGSVKQSNWFLSAIKEWGVPFDRQMISLAEKWFKETGDVKGTTEAIRWMIQDKLPFTDEIFRTVFAAVKRDPYSHLFGRLANALSTSPNDDYGTILQLLQKLTGKKVGDSNPLADTNWEKGEDVYRAIRFLLKGIGIDAATTNSSPSLKDLLSIVLEQKGSLPKNVSKAVQSLYDRIISHQLLNKEEDPYVFITFSIPLPLKGKSYDATFQWQGKKGEDGKIDPNFSRILFDLQMPQIGKTLIFMNVQNRMISLQVKSEQKVMKSIVQPYVQGLQQNLEQKGYYLSSVQFEVLRNYEQIAPETFATFQPGKVDLKI